MPKLPMGDIGPCFVIWDYSGTPLHVTPYLGKIELRWADTVNLVYEEGLGDAPVDGVFGGSVVELDVPMARNTLAQLAYTLGYGAMGSLGTGINAKVLTLRNMAGCDMYANACDIVIAPSCNNMPDPDPASWTHLYKCHPWRDFSLGFDRAEQRVHMVKYKIFPNQDSGYCGEYGTEGMASNATPITGFC